MRASAAAALCGIGMVAFAGGCAADGNDASWREGVNSPDGRIRLEFALVSDETRARALRYQVTFAGRPVILDSPLQVDLVDGTVLGVDCTVEDWKTTTERTEYRQVPGKRRRVIDSYSEGVLKLRELAKPNRRWRIVCRACNDAAAATSLRPGHRLLQDGNWATVAANAGKRQQPANGDSSGAGDHDRRG
ncbi:MAG: glycoside hydrolase family 97 N-terminal domain-containing protein [Phycisphaerae bacterium]|nr:glycoside hydrolase family 97 N-terminal domain-containing protein [Phycisphaerae bacterium]